MSQLITVSGMDGAGKSTQIRALVDAVENGGGQAVVLWHRPGYGPELDAAKAMLRRLRPGVLPRSTSAPADADARKKTLGRPGVRKTWKTLAHLDVLLQYAMKVRGHLARGRHVIADRWVEDGDIDLQLRFPELHPERAWLRRSYRHLLPKPDAQLLLMVSPEVGAARCAQKEEPFPDDPELRAARYAAYQHLARTGTHTVIDAEKPVDEVRAAVLLAAGVA